MAELLKKLVLLLLVVVVVGLPITDLVRFLVLVCCSTTIVLGTTRGGYRFIPTSVFAFLVSLAVHNLPQLRIEEGHQYFVTFGREDEILAKTLPPQVFEFMAREFWREHPRDGWCTPSGNTVAASTNCWVDSGPPRKSWAFSSDALFYRPKYSRQVSKIDFTGLEELRAGFANELNWYDRISDIRKVDVPYVVMYDLPSAAVGSELCWKGDLFWEETQGSFKPYLDGRAFCRTIEEADVAKRIFGVRVRLDQPLSISLTPPKEFARFETLADAIVIVVSLLIVWISVKIDLPNTGASLFLILLTVFSMPTHELRRFTAYPNLLGGSDGLVYEIFARDMVRQALDGNIAEVLKGSAEVFYFMPGMRYYLALGKPFWGDSGFAYLFPLLLLPIGLYFFARILWPALASLLLVACFLLVKLRPLEEVAWQLSSYSELALLGFAEPMGYFLFFVGAALVFKNIQNGSGESFLSHASLGSCAFAVAVILRPNLAVPVMFLLSFVAYRYIRARKFRGLAVLAFGFSPVLLMPLHNLYYGGELVLFTRATFHPINYLAPPSSYLKAFSTAFLGGNEFEHLELVRNHLRAWFGDWRKLGLGALVFLGLIWPSRFSWRFRMLGVANVGMHVLLLIFHPAGRYSYLAWNVTFLLNLVILVEYASSLGGLAKRAELLSRKHIYATFLLLVLSPLVTVLVCRLPGMLIVDLSPGGSSYYQGFKSGGETDVNWLETRRRARVHVPAVVEGPGVLELRIENPTKTSIDAKVVLPDGKIHELSLLPGGLRDVSLEIPRNRMAADVELLSRPARLKVYRVVWHGSIWPNRGLLVKTALLVTGSFLCLVLLAVSARAAITTISLLTGSALAASVLWAASTMHAISLIEKGYPIVSLLALGAVAFRLVLFRLKEVQETEPG